MQHKRIPPPACHGPVRRLARRSGLISLAALAISAIAIGPASAQQQPLDVTKLPNVPRDFILYRFFFAHVQSLENFANGIQSGAVAAAVAAKKPLSAKPQSPANPVYVAPPIKKPAMTASTIVATTSSATTASASSGIAASTVTPSMALSVPGDSVARHHIKTAAGLTDTEEALVKNIASQCLRDLAAFDKTSFATVKAITAKYPSDVKLSAADDAQVVQLEATREAIVTNYVAQLKSGMGAQRYATLYAFVVGSEAPQIKHRDVPVRRTK